MRLTAYGLRPLRQRSLAIDAILTKDLDGIILSGNQGAERSTDIGRTK